jgi:hypothetical protein
MYWDGNNSLGDPTTGIEILNYGLQSIAIPENACGFRLEKPGGWDEAWYFTEYGKMQPLIYQGIVFSSSSIFGTPPFIEAKGPVHSCDDGSYEFQGTMAAFGYTGDDLIIAGAGSFVAEFFDLSDITWLDHVGGLIQLPGEPPLDPIPEPGQEPLEPGANLPPEFFEPFPSIEGCFRDFEGNLHCPEEEETAAIAPGLNFIALGQGAPPPGIAMLVVAGSGIIPQFKVIPPPVGAVNTPSGSKVEVACPTELILTVTFHKAPAFEPAEVKYRFRFTHGPVSTVFSTVVDGEKSVVHSVPIPLPPPVGQGGGTGGVPLGPGNIAIFVEPPDVFPGGDPSVGQVDLNYQVKALPKTIIKAKYVLRSSTCLGV